MRIDSPLMTNAIATGSFSGSFAGTLAYDDVTSKPALISSSAQITAFGFSTTDNELNQEEVEDFAGALVATGGTKTGITVTYDDANGNMDFVVASQTDENFTTADHAKLDAIEASATADQTDAEIRAAVEAATDSNVFTDADHSKLNAIEASADVTDTANVTAAGAVMDSEVTDLAGIKGVTISTLQVKPSEGAFADGDKTKLDAIEASADVTDATNVTAAGALMDSELTSIADVKALNQSLVTGASPTFVGLTLTGDLEVQGTTTNINTADLNIEDKFILLNSGSATGNSGIIAQNSATNGLGTSLFFDDTANRWSLDYAGANANTDVVTADARIAAVALSNTDANYQKDGNIFIDSGDVFIYVE